MIKNLEYKPAETTVMILAAGEGRRMLPLTQKKPKPLLKIGSFCLIEHHLHRLSELGFNNIVINTAYLGHLIQQQLGDGSKYQLQISYSDESNTGALETAGGIVKALPLIESENFLVINADIWTNFNFTQLLSPMKTKGRLVLVNNPSHNSNGDFSLNNNKVRPITRHKQFSQNNSKSYTFSGVARYKKSTFSNLQIGRQALAPVLNVLSQEQNLEGIIHNGEWADIGTPERLEEIRKRFR